MSISVLLGLRNFSVFNCKGFNNGLSFLPALLDSFDVVLLQEHWLSDFELDRLCFDGFICSAISGFDNSVLLRGCPYGGCAVLYHQNLVSSFKQVTTSSRRFCAVKIMFQNCCCLLLNVYLPADYRSSAATDQLNDTLGELYGFISTVPHDFLIVAGDWNTDLHRSCSFTDIVLSFVYDLNLSLVDLNYSDDVRFTYMSHDGSKSWLDHVAVSTPFCSLVGSARSILDGRNLSDHNLLAFSLDLSVVTVNCPPATTFKRASCAWFKATPDNIDQYQSAILQSLAVLNSSLGDEVVFCCNPSCTAHQQHLEQVCDKLVKCLKEAADSSIPCRGPGLHRKVAGWSGFVKPELAVSQWWYKAIIYGWKQAVPLLGFFFSSKSMLISDTSMQFAELEGEQNISNLIGWLKQCSMILIAVSGSEARQFFSKRTSTSAPVVDDVPGSDNISKLWCNSFKKLYNTADGSASTELLNTLDSGITSADIEQISVSSLTV